ncbi:MAG: glycosyltransferase [Acidimicrobiia bacterium]|nr:glycosyltransferase [Acidimicrobiia bacterium]
MTEPSSGAPPSVADPFVGEAPMPTLAPPLPVDGRPVLSIVIVVHRMAAQALRTVASFCAGYQRGVESHQFEIVVVENDSDQMLSAVEVERLAPNVRYHARSETEPTPVNAVNAGVDASRGELVAVVVDGARMASPGLVAHTLAASRLADVVATVVPGYHLGRQLQQFAAEQGYDEAVEATLLDNIAWPTDGYRLFEIAVLSGTSKGGFFRPFAESNFLCVPRRLWDELGGMDRRFTGVGGGFANLDLYRRALEHPEVVPVMLPGEGTFHQFHGGATTGGTVAERREAIVESARSEYTALRGEPFGPPRKRFIYLGAIAPQALPFVSYSAAHVVHDPIQVPVP